MKPFITFYTPTYKRPMQLAACLASVAEQTAKEHIEQIVIPDHLGVGIAGMYANVPQYVDAVHGIYVHLLADDDVLASPDVVARVMEFASAHHVPPLILVTSTKDGQDWPVMPEWPPMMGRIDLGCAITRADIWKAHVKDYGLRYEGDFDFLDALYRAGVPAAVCSLRFLYGKVSRGVPEVAA